ncbi:glycosyltransferase [Sphingobacterium sp. UT-1RO-CII-1]|uniref:glycosyltransferase family 2 protein n=1 Tax=Sphingobacterium sp. UT-1RO-CII-1 TaxID=2995225 RepID=UPI00227C69A2|nr:glycosyltransferase [Sphingobacterium sp. UT-1RO-CII-1]MCY4781553.1 glycosyltransferase [Sphingobacterium sp. UT-1RO-CII-1]
MESISILIANYNNGVYFNHCYQSLINQTSPNWEAIVIDDCSTDNSVEIIKTLINNDHRFQFYQNKTNKGYQRTILKGIELSNHEIFARLDPDDALTSDAIELSLKTHNNNPEVGLVYSNLFICDNNLEIKSKQKAKQINELNIDYLNFKGEISHFATFKKSIYHLTTGIDPFIKRAEDKDIYMKMCEVAPVKHIDKELYLYRKHSGGVSTNDNSEKALFWHWVALIKMAERRNINIEALFIEHYMQRKDYLDNISRVKKSKWAKVGHKLGLFKAYKHL